MDFDKEILMMNEDEARKRARELLNENQVDLITKYMFLEQKLQKQKEVIDKLELENKVLTFCSKKSLTSKVGMNCVYLCLNNNKIHNIIKSVDKERKVICDEIRQ